MLIKNKTTTGNGKSALRRGGHIIYTLNPDFSTGCEKNREKAKKKTFFYNFRLDKQLFEGYLIQHTQNVAG